MRFIVYSVTLFLIVILMNSCTPVLKLVYGAHDPRLESAESIKKYLEKADMPDAIVLVAKDSVSFITLMALEKLRFPDLLLFNNAGEAMDNFNKAGCNAPVDVFIQNACHVESKVIDSLISFQEFMQYLKPLTTDDSLRFVKAESESVKYKVLMTSAKFGGKINKRDVAAWHHNIRNQKDCVINSYVLNLDFLEGNFSEEFRKSFK